MEEIEDIEALEDIEEIDDIDEIEEIEDIVVGNRGWRVGNRMGIRGWWVELGDGE